MRLQAETRAAERGRGAWLNGRRIRVSATRRLGDGVLSLWHDDSVRGDRRPRQRMARLALRVRSLRLFGAGFSRAGLLAGRPAGPRRS